MYPATKKYSALKSPVTDQDIVDFPKELSQNVGRHVGYSWLLPTELDPLGEKVWTVEDILMSQYKSGYLLALLKLRVRPEDVKHVEHVTRGQNDNALWYMYQKGRVTVSHF